MPVSKRDRTPLPQVTWEQHVERWKDCRKCPLCDQRYQICLARGTVPCDVLFIGEAPGASENDLGLPFKGPAGRLLDQIIARAFAGLNLTYALTNLVACFPREAKLRGDNEPEEDEVLACRPRLNEFINIAQPRIIACVGGMSTQYVDHEDTVPCVDLVHPAAILRSKAPQVKKDQDVNHITAVLRSAVECRMNPPSTFKVWGVKNAGLTKGQGLRQRYDAWLNDHSESDIPF